MATTASASDVQKNFGAYHDRAMSGDAVKVTRYGRETVVIVSVAEYRRMRRSERRALGVEELTDAEVALIEAAEVPESERYAMKDIAD